MGADKGRARPFRRRSLIECAEKRKRVRRKAKGGCWERRGGGMLEEGSSPIGGDSEKKN